MRQYEPIWNRLKGSTTPVEVRYSASNLDRLIRAVKKEKTAANVQRKALGLPAYGRLEIVVDEARRVVKFSISYNGDML